MLEGGIWYARIKEIDFINEKHYYFIKENRLFFGKV